jgi:hypothetical protein
MALQRGVEARSPAIQVVYYRQIENDIGSAWLRFVAMSGAQYAAAVHIILMLPCWQRAWRRGPGGAELVDRRRCFELAG